MASIRVLDFAGAVCQRKGPTFLNCAFILTFLLINSSVSCTKLNGPAANDENALYDSSLGSVSESQRGFAGTQATAHDNGSSDRIVADEAVPPEHSVLASNVELKSITPHPGGDSPPPSEQSNEPPPEDKEAVKSRYLTARAREEELRRQEKEKFDKVVKEIPGAAAAHRKKYADRPIYSAAPTEQEKAYREQQKALEAIPPSKKEQLLALYRRGEAQKEKARRKYGEVVAELKQKLEERAQKQARRSRRLRR